MEVEFADLMECLILEEYVIKMVDISSERR